MIKLSLSLAYYTIKQSIERKSQGGWHSKRPPKPVAKAFTLAEILVTLGVIGVIASMTGPTLVQDVQDAQFKTAWKKTFAEFSQATMQLRIDNGADLSGAFGDIDNQHDSFRNRFLPYLSYTKLCNVDSPTGIDGCFHKSTNMYKLSGSIFSTSPTNFNSWSRMVLNNGTLYAFALRSPTCIDDRSPNDDTCGNVITDINGFKGPNKVGKDILGFNVLKNGNIIPYGTQGDNYYNQSSTSCNVKQYPNTEGWSCSADYLYQ